MGVVESVKSVSDIYCPVSGKVVEINEPLTDQPELLNDDCYGEGWLVRLEVDSKDELDDLLSAEEYEAYLKEDTE